MALAGECPESREVAAIGPNGVNCSASVGHTVFGGAKQRVTN
jgi:hypothetical protein